MPQVTVALDRGTWEMLEMARLQEGHEAQWFIQHAITMALNDLSGLDWSQAQLCGELIVGSRGETSATISEQHDAALTGWSEEFNIERTQLIRFLLRSYISLIPDKRSGVALDLSHFEAPDTSAWLAEARRVLDGRDFLEDLFGSEGIDFDIDMIGSEDKDLSGSKDEDPPVPTKTFSYKTDDEIERDLNRQVELSKEVLFRSYLNSLKSWIDKCERDMRRIGGSNELFKSTQSNLDLDYLAEGVPKGESDRLRFWREFVAETVRQRGIFWTNIEFRALEKEYRAWIFRQINL